jgi:uncharacterized protein (DUF433 family)
MRLAGSGETLKIDMPVLLDHLPESLHLDPDAVVRVGHTRVTLDTLFSAFSAGATPEQIVVDFPSLDLADVYSAIGYILRNRQAVLEYVRGGETNAAAFRDANPDLYPTGIRERLLARQQSAKAT